MAISVSSVRTAKVPGDEVWTETDVTFDESYPTGGEVVTPAQLGLNRVTGGFCNVKTPGTAKAVNAFFDVDNLKVKLNVATVTEDEEEAITGVQVAELANEASAASTVVRVYAYGK